MLIFLKGEPGFIGPQGEPGLPGLPGTKVSGVFFFSFLSEFFGVMYFQSIMLKEMWGYLYYLDDHIFLPHREPKQPILYY